MWCLRRKTGETFFQLLCGEEYTVGRKDVQIIVDGDASVSRSHALLTVSTVPDDRIDDVSFVPLLRLKDLGSKYGTRLNNVRLAANEETVVRNGDTVTFGQLGSSFTVHYEPPMVITSSCLQPDEKEKLKESAAKLGGRVMPEWSDACTHLVMSSIRLTVKTTSALVAAKPVVKPTFLYDTVSRLRSKNWMDLNPSDYIPDISEENLTVPKEELGQNPARKTLFSGKVFYFLDKSQHAKLAPLLVSGGGRVELARDPNKPRPVYLEENSCVFKPSHGIPDHPVCKFLTKNKLRAIPESDVALAVAHCSTQKHCNPRSTAVVAFWGNSHTLSSQSQAFSPGEVYVPNTEDDSEVDCRGKKVVLTARTIPESRQLSVTPAASRPGNIPSASTLATTLNGGQQNTHTATSEEPSLKITLADPNSESPSQKSPSRLSLSQKRSSRLLLRSSSKSPSQSPAEPLSGHGLRSARRLRMASDSPPKSCPKSPLQSLSVVSTSPVTQRTVLCVSRPSRSKTSNTLTSSTSKTACRVTVKSPSRSPPRSPSKLCSKSPSKPSTSKTSNIATRSASKSPSKTRSASKALSRETSKSPSKSPSKIRKKDAAGSLPLELYFSPCKKRRGANGTNAEPAAKLPRLAEAGDTVYIKAEDDIEEIKDEPPTPPPAEPELQLSEDPMDMAPHEMNGAEDSIAGSGSRLELAQQMPSCELEEADWARKDGLDSALATAAIVAGTDELSDEADERSMVVVEFENLVLANSSRRNETVVVNADSGPNFKRFRKVNKDQRRGLPKIIGGPDLLVYVPNQPEEVYSDEDPASQNHADLFNYNPPDPKRRRQ